MKLTHPPLHPRNTPAHTSTESLYLVPHPSPSLPQGRWARGASRRVGRAAPSFPDTLLGRGALLNQPSLCSWGRCQG